MIRKVTIRRFKRFENETFDLEGRHVVLAGPNNTGKTTVLQAIAAWSLGLERWKELNDYQRHGGSYARAPITRQTFSAVPLRRFDLLWRERNYQGNIEVEVCSTEGWSVTMEFIADSTEQVYVRPKSQAKPPTVREATLGTVFVPPMTGLGTDEAVYQPPKLSQLIGQCRPGEVIRNLLVLAYNSQDTWQALTSSIRELFSYELLAPDASGPAIIVEYRERPDGPAFDIGSGGSGFQQVLMLLTFLHTRPGTVLLLDEPDAHLHVYLQDTILGHLRSAAVRSQSQLIMATHSEVIIDAAGLDELYVLAARPMRLTDRAQRDALDDVLRYVDNMELIKAVQSPGVLYLEDYTDLDILREWASVLGHPADDVLTHALFWKKLISDSRTGTPGLNSQDHYRALQLVRPNLPALELVDGDSRATIVSTPITGQGYQRQRWRRYEVESYLIHPEAIARYVVSVVGEAAAAQHVADLRKCFEDNFPPAVVRDPLGEHEFLNNTKARTKLLPPLLSAAGLPGIPYTDYYRIAALMKPEEIHPEVTEKLDAICKAFGVDA
jgi:predicted ATPase